MLEDFSIFPTMCGKISYDHVCPGKRGLQLDPTFCQHKPGLQQQLVFLLKWVSFGLVASNADWHTFLGLAHALSPLKIGCCLEMFNQ